jgi:AcrR family transcriptional regulator
VNNARNGRRGSGRPPAGTESVRDALLRAGATHFSTYGFAGANVRSILADAGATAPALYHHFGNKIGLYIAAASAAQERVLEVFTAAAIDRADGNRVAALIEAAIALRREHPNVARYLAVIQQDVDRHPELSELSSYETRFEEFWEMAASADTGPGRAVALRAVVEGLLAVGGAKFGLDEVAAGADVLTAVLASSMVDDVS